LRGKYSQEKKTKRGSIIKERYQLYQKLLHRIGSSKTAGKKNSSLLIKTYKNQVVRSSDGNPKRGGTMGKAHKGHRTKRKIMKRKS